MKTIKDENGNPLIGYMNVGGVILKRSDLTKRLPDFPRFERCLSDAEMVNDHMTKYGKPPAVFFGWSGEYRDDVADTMREVGALQHDAANQLRAALTVREELEARS